MGFMTREERERRWAIRDIHHDTQRQYRYVARRAAPDDTVGMQLILPFNQAWMSTEDIMESAGFLSWELSKE